MTMDSFLTRTICLLTLLLAATTISADDAKYFVSDSLRGTLSTNNPPTQAMFHSGKYNRTYVLYVSDTLMAKITYYDIGPWARPAVLSLTILRGEHTIHNCNPIVAAAHNTPLRWKEP